MSKRFNNKTLLYILGGLLVILALTFLVKIPKEKATLKESFALFDTSLVSKIVFIPKVSVGEPFSFVRKNRTWEAIQGKITAVPAKGAIQNIFSEVLAIKPQSLVAVGKSGWKEYELTDSLATRLQFINLNGKIVADVLIGKFTYKQAANQFGYSGGGNIDGTTYVRAYGENEVYGVNGFLSFSFGGTFSDWRDRSFLRSKKEDITKVSFTFPSDTSFILEKTDKIWYLSGLTADSVSVSRFLNTLSFLDGKDIDNTFKPSADPVCQMQVIGNNLLNISVKCYKNELSGEYVLNSSLNPDVYFSSKPDGIFSQIFRPKKSFLKK